MGVEVEVGQRPETRGGAQDPELEADETANSKMLANYLRNLI